MSKRGKSANLLESTRISTNPDQENVDNFCLGTGGKAANRKDAKALRRKEEKMKLSFLPFFAS
jgi:hypothetical protein